MWLHYPGSHYPGSYYPVSYYPVSCYAVAYHSSPYYPVSYHFGANADPWDAETGDGSARITFYATVSRTFFLRGNRIVPDHGRRPPRGRGVFPGDGGIVFEPGEHLRGLERQWEY